MCQECSWENFIEEINDYLSDPDYDWAEETLSGIANTVEENSHVTDRQKEAVENIVEAVERKSR